MRMSFEDDVRQVIDYLYDGEEQDYKEMGKPKNHIFIVLKRIEHNLSMR